MISVLTITYQRKALLEEAIESFLRQDFSGESEMLIINDYADVDYEFDHPRIRIINRKERFPSIGQKLKYGFSECHYDHIYRLDDDDLLAPWALRHSWDDITAHPDYEIYRSNGHYFFEHNVMKGISGNVNNGNIYTKKYLSRIEIPDSSIGEDYAMTFDFNAKIYTSTREQKTMIYRWGMNTYHVSGMGNKSNDIINQQTDCIVSHESAGKNTDSEKGLVVLNPHFQKEYFELI